MRPIVKSLRTTHTPGNTFSVYNYRHKILCLSLIRDIDIFIHQTVMGLLVYRSGMGHGARLLQCNSENCICVFSCAEYSWPKLAITKSLGCGFT